MYIDFNDPHAPVAMLSQGWLKGQDQRLQDYRADMYSREVTLARVLLKCVDDGEITEMEYSCRMSRLTFADSRELARLEMEINACPIHEGCYGKGEGHE